MIELFTKHFIFQDRNCFKTTIQSNTLRLHDNGEFSFGNVLLKTDFLL